MTLLSNNSEPEDDGSNWKDTYMDMVTLLLAFFVLLFAFSTIDITRFEALMIAIQNQLVGSTSMLHGGESMRLDPAVQHRLESDSLWDNYSVELEPLQDILDRIQLYIEREELKSHIGVYLEGRGLVIRITDGLLFNSGQAEIQSQAQPILLALAEALNEIDNPIQIEGHADNIPIHTERFPSNWELSAARALSVLHFFVSAGDVDPHRLAATAYGEYRPLWLNDTPELRAKNRRVEIVLLRKGIQDKAYMNPELEADFIQPKEQAENEVVLNQPTAILEMPRVEGDTND